MAGNQSFGQVMAQIGDFLKGLSLGQKLLLAGGAVTVAATLLVFVRLLGKPDYKPLYSAMDAAEAQTVAARLKSKNVDYQLSADGKTVSVAADQLDKERLEMASSGLPHSGRLGFELFDKTNWSGSDFSEKVNYQRALEGELERTIQTLGEVESARVHLVLGSESIFAEREREAKASIILKLRGHRLSPEAQAALPRLVGGAVDHLRPENVTVVDAETGRPLTGTPGATAATSDLEHELAARLVSTLEPVVGAERVRASVRVEFDTSTSEESEERYDPATTVTTAMHKREEETHSAAPAGGVPGTASNIPSAATVPAKPGDATRVERSEDGSYAVNRTQRRVVRPAGRIGRLAAALVVDDAVEQKLEGEAGQQQIKQTRRKRTPEEMKQIEELARAAIGVDEKRGDQLVVQNLGFEQLPQPVPASPTALQRMRTELNRWSDVVRYAIIALLFGAVYLMLLRPVKRQMLASFRQLGPATGGAAQRLAKVERSEGVVETELAPDGLPEGSAESQRIATMKRRIVDKVKVDPAAATRLVQSWLQQSGPRQEEEEV